MYELLVSRIMVRGVVGRGYLERVWGGGSGEGWAGGCLGRVWVSGEEGWGGYLGRGVGVWGGWSVQGDLRRYRLIQMGTLKV